MSDCKSCNTNSSDDADPILPSGGGGASFSDIPPVTPETPPAVVVNCGCQSQSSTKNCGCKPIIDSCGCPKPIINPLAKLTTNIAFAIPECGQSVDVTFKEDISGLMPGLEIYGVDPLQRTIRLLITIVTPKNKLTLKNICSSCCASTKPVGEAVLSGTLFSWGIPGCCTSGSISPTTDCLVGTFFFPAAGATSPANVPNANNFVLGGIYSLGGFLWKVVSRVTTTQILLENPSPGNGSTVGGFLEGGENGECIYPITPVSGTDPCNDAAVLAVAVLGCTVSGEKKLFGTVNCGVLTYNSGDGTVSVKAPFGGSASTGPHYIQYDAVNPCNSKLVLAPDLAGAACATLSCSLFLTPANTSNEYEVEVSTATPFTTTPPNNVITLSNRQFTVVAIVTVGTLGKIRITPRFAVTASETIPEGSTLCVVEGCQPFPASDWPFAGTLDAHGMPVYCSSSGLRGMPEHASLVASTDFTDTTDINIQALGNHDQALVTIGVTNPSVSRNAKVSGNLSIVYQLRMDTDGAWFMDTLFDIDVAPTVTPLPVRAIPIAQDYDQNVNIPFAFDLLPAQTRSIQFIARVRTTNASANAGVLFRGYQARVVTHLTTTN